MSAARRRRDDGPVATAMPHGGAGRVVRVDGPVVEAEGLVGAAMFDLITVGPAALPGEILAIRDGVVTTQVYGYTGGLRVGDVMHGSGHPLQAALGPGLLGGVFDGVLRPLGAVEDRSPSRPREWRFQPATAGGHDVAPGELLGTVQETESILHRILVPPGLRGSLDWMAPSSSVGGESIVATIAGRPVSLTTGWPVRRPRPVGRRLAATARLATGQRIIDLLFPIAQGSTAGVPGGFGTGKTLLLQQIAKWCDADVIVYVGCGERGNEMADVLQELPALDDPRTGRSLMERTVIIANTSNMPIMAREASIYTAVTVAEYYRDMGYDAVVIADSTSRWAEALREFASRTDQLPAEEGYPANLASALAAFYERAGRVETLGGKAASVTVIGSVSPPGADMTEPVTAYTRRFVRCLWSLDRDLAYARHYPAVSWRESFSRDVPSPNAPTANTADADWASRRSGAMALLAEADRLEPLVQLMGAAALPDLERLVLGSARVLREGVLQQDAGSPTDARCGPARQAALLDMALAVNDARKAAAARGVPADHVDAVDLSPAFRARELGPPDDPAPVAAVAARLVALLAALQ
jgi:V/A-type H+-transporting ATPase subunit A